MPGILARIVAALLVGALGGLAAAQDAHTRAPISDGGCNDCHTCDEPSSAQPCLRACPRTSPDAIARQLSQKPAPEVVILDELEDRYLPVPFDHKGHAEMAKMTRGCAVCHHYTPAGVAHPACKTCHEVKPAREEIHKPGLKGAYHRQCLSCHREWSEATACEVCHLPKTARGQKGQAMTSVTKDDIVGRMHPPIPEPEVEVYRTKWEGDTSSRVLFRHKAHIHNYDLRCSDCHHEDNCTRCHEEGKEHTQRVRTLDDNHVRSECDGCHVDRAFERPPRCDQCHEPEEGISFPVRRPGPSVPSTGE